jgi:hypothetical protein
MSKTPAIAHRPTKDFTFGKITISTTAKKVAGWYFAKIAHEGRPLYIEVPEVLSKAGFVKVNSQTVCDLMFSPKEEEEVLTWFEDLVSRCHSLLSEHANDWFSQPFSVNDIEAVFDCPMKSYKSGHFQLCRCIVTTTGDHPTVVYDETQNRLAMEDVDIGSDTRIAPIIEVCGISFTTSRFRLSLKIKQLMIVVDTDPVEFETCMIHRAGRGNTGSTVLAAGKIPMNIRPEGVSGIQSTGSEEDGDIDTDIKEHEPEPVVLAEPEPEPVVLAEPEPEPEPIVLAEPEPEPVVLADPEPEPEPEPVPEQSEWDSLVSAGEIVSIDPEVTADTSTVDLKNPIQVYQQRYGRAKKRAQKLKSDAIRAILEANSIKDAYSMLNYADSESDISDIELEIE